MNTRKVRAGSEPPPDVDWPEPEQPQQENDLEASNALLRASIWLMLATIASFFIAIIFVGMMI